MGKGLNGWGKLWPPAIIAVVLGAVAYWQWGLKADTSPTFTYGPPEKTFFKPAEVTEGGETELCFHGIVWYRVKCPSYLTTYLSPEVGDRLDLEGHKIGVPPKAGPVEPKCRPWKVPKIGDRSPKMTFWGFAESLCGKQDDPVRIITHLPRVPITINKR
jgi:hypothetical protein